MNTLVLDYDTLMERYTSQERTQLLGLSWLIESLTRTYHPVRGPEVRLLLSAQPDPSGKLTSGSVRLVFRQETEDISLAAYSDHVERCKRWAQDALQQMPTGAALSTLINALEFNPGTKDHEAIERGRQEILAGRLETREQFMAFIESIS